MADMFLSTPRRQLAFAWEEQQCSLGSCPRAVLTLLSSVITSPKGLNRLDRLHTLARSTVTDHPMEEAGGVGVRGLGEVPEPCRTQGPPCWHACRVPWSMACQGALCEARTDHPVQHLLPLKRKKD